jgi:PKD repeat protein
VADYLPVLTQFICEGGSITFTDKSYRALPTQYTWSFPGGTPSTSFSQNPTVTYSTPGTYTVTLTVSNAIGNNTLTRNTLIKVMPNTAQVQDTLLQSFESADIGAEGWEIINKVPGSVGFQSNNAGYVSGKCLWLNNFQEQTSGSADELISPSYNLSVIDSPFISFRYAYAQKTTSASSNRLQVYLSTDCGKTWILRYNVSGNTLGTVTATNASFTPTNTTQWRTVNLSNIAGFASSTNLRIRFLFTSGGDGNNFFLDHVRVSGRNTFASTEENNALQSTVYPNPASQILYADAPQAILGYQVFDLSGRLLISENTPQTNHQEIPINGLAKGIYILRLNHAKRTEQVRFVVQ